jgi:hypothetical protein
VVLVVSLYSGHMATSELKFFALGLISDLNARNLRCVTQACVVIQSLHVKPMQWACVSSWRAGMTALLAAGQLAVFCQPAEAS